MPEGMHTYSLSGAPHESTQAFDAWRLPKDQRTRRNRLDLRGLPSPVAPAQARPAVGGALRGDDQTVGRSGQKHRRSTWLTLGCVVVCPLGGLDVREASARTRDGSVSRRECRGACVHWVPGRSQPPDSRPCQHCAGVRRPGQGGGGRDQCTDPPCRQGLWLCRPRDPVVGYHRAGVAHWLSQRTWYPAGLSTALWPRPGEAQTGGVVGVDAALEQVQTILRSVKAHHLFTKGKQAKRQVLTRR